MVYVGPAANVTRFGPEQVTIEVPRLIVPAPAMVKSAPTAIAKFPLVRLPVVIIKSSVQVSAPERVTVFPAPGLSVRVLKFFDCVVIVEVFVIVTVEVVPSFFV